MMPTSNRSLVSAALVLMLAQFARSGFGDDSAKPQPPTTDQIRFFEAKIRPVLVDNCVKCHGAEKQKSNLRLDSRKLAMAGGDSGPAVVPGKPDESLLVLAIRHGDEAPKMPPSKKLAKPILDDLTNWVAMGAPWPDGESEAAAVANPAPGAASKIRKQGQPISDEDRAHWAYQPIRRAPLPKVADASWSKNPIDAWIRAGLDAKGLTPNQPANRTALIRRATYDLTGLPPTLDEVAQFLDDKRPDAEAYEALIDRLLASPHYGEKWGRHWLDLVRYAETNSYERDNPKPNAWGYRDYVIRSFNEDKPYDKFVFEQLAGDEIADGGPDALTATGYYRLGIWDDEPTDRLQSRYDGLDDIVATTGQVFLGLTVDCARCHDHKIDPIPQKDYYKLLAFFHNINHFRNGGETDEAPIFRDAEAKKQFAQKVLELQRERDALQAKIQAVETEFLTKYDEGNRAGANGSVQVPDLDGLRYRFYRDTWDKLPEFDILKPEEIGVLEVPRFDLGKRTRDDAFGFVFEAALIVPSDGDYTFYLDSDDGSRLSVEGKTVVDNDGIHKLGTEKSATIPLKAGRHPIRLDYFQRTEALGLNVAWSSPGFQRRRLSAAKTPGPKGPEIAQLLRSDGERILGKAKLAELRGLRQELKSKSEIALAPEKALVVTEQGPAAPETHVLIRGNPHVEGDKVEPGFPSVLTSALPALPVPPEGAKTTGRRTVLAKWIVGPGNPLTPRVIANRVWQYHFGRGIVRSTSNFGTQGDKPTHPELLDELASELLENGWRLKPLHKRIMMSETYRMSSAPNADSLAKDGSNDAFWRFDMRRLTAEEIRDSILSVSGQLNPAMFGPSMYPPIPDEVKAGQSIPGYGWHSSTPEEVARRSIYIHVKRSLMMPILETFDAAETDRSSPVRFTTTQPTQALAMVNSVFLNDQAKHLTERLKHEAGLVAAAQVKLAIRLATSRTPSVAEVDRGVSLIEKLKLRDGLGDDEALKDFSLVVLNLNEFLYLD